MRTRDTLSATTFVAGLGLALALSACGGKAKPADTTPADDGAGAPTADDGGGDLVPPERMDEITRLLERKRTSAARCLSDAVNAGKADKNARGHVSIGFTIGTGGHAQDAKVLETSIDNDTVEACIIGKIEEIDFGALPRPLEWSYAYAFESM
ncbi:MAG: AgmX/PglI C-terminal domain-containing protein [Kofleriaceae bacterium]